MSMSSLGAQLASLSNKASSSGKQNVPSSRSHQESVGRGLYHSAQHGHSMQTGSMDSSRFKPSVLYPDARAAAKADIPLTTLRENAVASLSYLSRNCSDALFRLSAARHSSSSTTTALSTIWHELLGPSSLKYERGLNTKSRNAEMDKHMKNALTMLGSAWGDTIIPKNSPLFTRVQNGTDDHVAVDIPSSILHVLEYVLQKHHPHIYVPEAFLISFLPHHESPLFQRILQLVDLATMVQWNFLRPYAADGAEAVPRTKLVRWAASTSKNGGGVALISSLCCLAKDVSKFHSWDVIHALEQNSNKDNLEGYNDINSNSTPAPNNVRRGLALVLSFVAAVVAESLAMQNSSLGTLSETTVRCIMPHALCAVGPTEKRRNSSQSIYSRNGNMVVNHNKWSLGTLCQDFRYLGYALISALMVQCELGADVKEVFATAIIDGVLEVKDMMSYISNSEDNVQQEHAFLNTATMQVVNTTADALVVVYSLIFNYSKGISDKTVSGTNTPTEENKTLLPSSTFRSLMKHQLLPLVLGHLVEEDDANFMIVKWFVLHFVNTAISKLKDFASDSDNFNDRKSESIQNIIESILTMVKEQSLAQIWTDRGHSPTAEITQSLLSLVSIDPDSNNENIKNNNKVCASYFLPIFSELRAIDSAGCDIGIMRAVNTIASNDRIGEKGLSAQRVVQFLQSTGEKGFMVGSSQVASLSENTAKINVVSKSAKKDISQSESQSFLDQMLPSRVALEHANATVRLDAIRRIVEDSKISENIRSDSDAMDHDPQVDHKDDDGKALLRRIVYDDNIEVCFEASNAVCSLLSQNNFSARFFNENSVINDILLSLHKWSVLDKQSKEEKNKMEANDSKGERSGKMYTDNLFKERCNILCNVLKIAAMPAKEIANLSSNEGTNKVSDMGTKHQNLELLVEGIVSHIHLKGYLDNQKSNSFSHVEISARESFLQISQEDIHSSNIDERALLSVSTNVTCVHLAQNCLQKLSDEAGFISYEESIISAEIELKQRFLWTYIQSATLRMKRSKDRAPLELSMRISLRILGGLENRFMHILSCKKIISNFVDCLKACSVLLIKDNNYDKIIELFNGLCSISSFDKVEKFLISLIKSIGITINEKSNCNFAGIVLMLEAVSQPNNETKTTVQLIKLLKSLLHTISDDLDENDALGPYICVIMLSLLGHSASEVRKETLGLLKHCGGVFQKSKGDTMPYYNIFALDSSMKSAILMDGENTMIHFLSKLVSEQEHGEHMRHLLLKGCVVSVQAMKQFKLPKCPPYGSGGCNACKYILDAMESAGEQYFPLSSRWKEAGKDIFMLFLEYEGDNDSFSWTQQLMETVVIMVKGVTIDKSNINSSSIIMTTGPSEIGRRSRSYSVGTSDGISYVKSYPDDMTKCIIRTILAHKGKMFTHVLQNLCDVLNRLVLGRYSWIHGIFPRINNEDQIEIALGLLDLRVTCGMESAGDALLKLPLSAHQLCFILSSNNSPAHGCTIHNFLALTFLLECIRDRSDTLVCDHDVFELSSTLFDRISYVSNTYPSSNEISSSDLDYAKSSLVNALLSIHEKIEISIQNNDYYLITSNGDLKQKTIYKSSHLFYEHIVANANLLVALIGDTSANDKISPLLSFKGKGAALKLLTDLCSLEPNKVIAFLIPSMMKVMSSFYTIPSGVMQSKAIEKSLLSVVTVYCRHASTNGLHIFDLLCAYFFQVHKDDYFDCNAKTDLYNILIDTLLSISNPTTRGNVVSSIVSSYVAGYSYVIFASHQDSDLMIDESTKNNKSQDMNGNQIPSRLLSQLNQIDQISAMFEMLRVVENLIAKKSDAEYDDKTAKIDDICCMATHGKTSLNIKVKKAFQRDKMIQNNILWMAKTLMSIIKDSIKLSSIKSFISSCDSQEVEKCLGLWQELMIIQMIAAEKNVNQEGDRNSSENWSFISRAADECLAILHEELPLPHFLASISSLMNDEDVEISLRKRSVSLLAERSEKSMSIAEVTLFWDMVPDLIALLSEKSENADQKRNHYNTAVLRQASLIAIDQLARSPLPEMGNQKVIRKRDAVFTPVLKKVTYLMNHTSSSLTDQSSNDCITSHDAMQKTNVQLFCTSALCASTLVTILKARSVPQLPELLNSLLASLSSVNSLLERRQELGIVSEEWKNLKLFQLTVIRTFVSVAEMLPQFLVSYLDQLILPTMLASKELRKCSNEDEILVRDMTERLEIALATRAPVRQLIPSLSTGIVKSFVQDKTQTMNTFDNSMCLLNILNMSIRNASRAEIGPIIGKVMNALIRIYNFDCSQDSRFQLLNFTNETLVSLVMKLSEVQLRPLYAKLKDWRGEFDEKTLTRTMGLRRQSFWSLSAVISAQLRSIFLPCMSTVINDAAKELEYAVACLCTSTKEANGKKRRKLERTQTDFDVSNLYALQPLLLCLESTFKADAHDGGNWIRSEDGERFAMIVTPLGKLLEAKIPPELGLTTFSERTDNSISPYKMFVQGINTEDNGNVVSCLVALAAAAGNEQMWKPLNHSILEACGHSSRSEVRKAGITALLSMIQTLGEEYMVLLPECLPVLSELLEDEDEETISLTKECIKLSEDLLGESLEDTLR
eukprot:CAMPEP_0184859192 /NCGR_PEP_ID=MMETSP0580-20130426/4196_1 /TAXON_ID=1118495 /ORGANISM="Dactyliosolen fragilissimus" /LENGTH=2583 /DNA_ID=CAMNT_0027355677 /DNA_START=18 /DNA_END=7769 /DNA_ORIENTATION=+